MTRLPHNPQNFDFERVTQDTHEGVQMEQARLFIFILGALMILLVASCGEDKSSGNTDKGTQSDADSDADTDGDTDADTDGDADADSDADSDSDSDSDADGDKDSEWDTLIPRDTDSQCGDTKVPFETNTPTVLLVVDRSGSMGETLGGGMMGMGDTRWNVARDALVNEQTGFIKLLESEMRFGLAMYAGADMNGNGECPSLEIVEPNLNNYDEIAKVYLASEPLQNTPTPDAIMATSEMLLHDIKDSEKIIVLVTDGLPDTCEDPNAQDAEGARQAAVDAVTAAREEGITTYVISVGLQDTTGHFQDLADAGIGEENAPYYETNDQDGLKKAFESIIYGLRKCKFDLEGKIDKGQEVKCDVKFVHDDATETAFSFDEVNGWVAGMSEDGNNSQLELVGDACEVLKKSKGELVVDCPCGVVIPEAE